MSLNTVQPDLLNYNTHVRMSDVLKFNNREGEGDRSLTRQYTPISDVEAQGYFDVLIKVSSFLKLPTLKRITVETFLEATLIGKKPPPIKAT